LGGARDIRLRSRHLVDELHNDSRDQPVAWRGGRQGQGAGGQGTPAPVVADAPPPVLIAVDNSAPAVAPPAPPADLLARSSRQTDDGEDWAALLAEWAPPDASHPAPPPALFNAVRPPDALIEDVAPPAVIDLDTESTHTQLQFSATPHSFAPVSAAAVQPVAAASPAEMAAMELLLAEPLNREIVAAYLTQTGAALPTLGDGATAQNLVARYGADLAGRLQQLSNALAGVRRSYLQAYDVAAQADGVFDAEQFTLQYAQGRSLAQRAFAALHPPEEGRSSALTVSTQYAESDTTTIHLSGGFVLDGAGLVNVQNNPNRAEQLQWQPARLTNHALLQIDPNAPPELHDPTAVWFDPNLGFVTSTGNRVFHQDWIDKAMPVVFIAVMTWATCGAAGVAGGAGVTAGTAVTGTGVSGAMAAGAAFGAVGAAYGGLVNNGRISLRDMFKGALTGAVTAGVSNSLGLNTAGVDSSTGQVTNYALRAMAITGQATLQGALQKLAGGEFKDGFTAGMASGLGAEVARHLDLQIQNSAKAGDITPEQASVLSAFSKAAKSAIVMLAHPDDPGYAFAQDFISALVQDAQSAVPPTEQVAGADEPDPRTAFGRFIPNESHDEALADVNAHWDIQPEPNGFVDLPDDQVGSGDGDPSNPSAPATDVTVVLDPVIVTGRRFNYGQALAQKLGGELEALFNEGKAIAGTAIAYAAAGLELLDIPPLKAFQGKVEAYLLAKADAGGLSEAETIIFATLYAANQVLMPVNALDFTAGIGKGISAAAVVIKAGKGVDELAQVVRADSKAVAELVQARVAQVTQQAKADGLELIAERGGSRGAWNSALNGELRPNAVYLLNNGHSYVTDGAGRVTRAEGLLDMSKADRNTWQQAAAGHAGGEGYDGGHLIATLFGGAGEKINLVPQLSTVNRGEFRVMEGEWAKAVLEGKKVTVEVTPIYSGSAKTPTEIVARWWIDGVPSQKRYPNTTGG
jgi:DNA/RNA non-specific endonuclease